MVRVCKIDKIKIFFSDKNLICILFWYRLVATVVMYYVAGVKEVIKRGDTPLYLFANPVELFKSDGFFLFLHQTKFTQFFVGSVHMLLRYEVLTHIVFSLLAFYGIKYFLDAIPEKNNKYYKILILMTFLPSFTLWSSVAGKEPFVVFAMGIIAGEAVRFFSGKKFRFSFLVILAIFLVCIIKNQYMPAIFILVLYMKLREKINLSWKADLLILIAIIAANCVLIYLFRNKIDTFSLNRLQEMFPPASRSTRERVFIEQYDFFKKMPYLLPLAVWGPVWNETKTSIFHLAAFIENFFILGAYLYLIKDFFIKIFKNFNIYYQWFFVSLLVIGWLFIAQYIQGVLNPGAAIRYRTNIYLLVTALYYSVTCIKDRVFFEEKDAKNNLTESENETV